MVRALSKNRRRGARPVRGRFRRRSQKPDVREGVFGFHEVFRALTIVGASPHFVAETRFVRDDAARVRALHAGHGALDALASSVAAH